MNIQRANGRANIQHTYIHALVHINTILQAHFAINIVVLEWKFQIGKDACYMAQTVRVVHIPFE